MIITILALISVVAYTSFGVRQNKAINTKIQSEIISLSNALISAKQENNILPQPQWNRNFFAEDTSYVHDFEDNNTFWVHWFITHNTLAKKYIDIVPVDPRTGSFYAYWKTKKNWPLNEMYEIASVIWDADTPKSYVIWDYTAENGPLNLIREYNGPDFVYEDSTLHFPYNPNERVLTATIDSYTWSVTINWLNTYSESELLSFVLKSWDTIEVSQNWAIELYYSDWSRSVLWDNSNNSVLTLQKMEFIQDNNIITDIKLVLESWMIWNKAASLDDESGFEIYTTDSTAAVRWTIFWVQKNGNNSEIVVQKWKVAVNQNLISSNEIIKEYIKNDDIIPSSPITSLPWIIDFDSTNQESVIEVINNEPEKWASIWVTAISNSTWSINDIPDDIVDTVINSTPIINNNIKFSLKEYSYSTNPAEINITLNIPKKVYESVDFLLLNGKDIIYKDNNNWWNPAVLSWTIYTQILDNNTLAPTNSINESQLQTRSRKVNIPNNVTEFIPNNNTWNESNFFEQGPWNNATESFQSEHSFKIFPQVNASNWWLNIAVNLYDYITEQINQNNHDFTIQLGKKSLHWKIRLTEKIRFTLIDDKSYENEEDKNEEITEDEVREEEDKKLAEKKWVEWNCDWFLFDNISGDKGVCADADDDLVSNNWNLVAFAPYDNPGDLKMYNSWSTISVSSDQILNNNCLPKLWVNPWLYFYNSTCITTSLSINHTWWYSSSLIKNLLWIWSTINDTEYRTIFQSVMNYDIINSHFNWLPNGFWNWEKWIFIDNAQYNDYIKYNNLDISWKEFIIEMNVRIWDLNKRYLMHSWNNFKLFINNWYLYVNDWWSDSLTYPELLLNQNHFNNIKVKNSWWFTFLKVWSNNWKKLSITASPENYSYVWSFKIASNYYWQINSIVDFIKIYK